MTQALLARIPRFRHANMHNKMERNRPALPVAGGQTTHHSKRHKSLADYGLCLVERTGNSLEARSSSKPLRVMKFGGTSLGDACCISNAVEIIRAHSRDTALAVVVSAMSGVTSKLNEAARLSEAGDRKRVTALFKELREQHDAVVKALIHSPANRNRISRKIRQVFREGQGFCQAAMQGGAFTPSERDAIAGVGERVSAPLVAAVLAEFGVASEAIEATHLVVTNSLHGSADPQMNLTRERCQARLLPLSRLGVIPVVTGYIGATPDGVLTTLGRGGSDYSATILGAALDAAEVIIWTDVDGMLTADPRLVIGARIIPEISYREAADLAHFGAKVLHPKTLRPLLQSGIPVWIRNTFAPERPGTRITPAGPAGSHMVRAVTAICDVALIAVDGLGISGLRDVSTRIFTTTAAVPAEVLLVLQSASRNSIRFVVSSALAQPTVDALRREFAKDLADEDLNHIALDSTVAIVAAVGQNLCGESETVERMFSALQRENVKIIAMARDCSDDNISFLVAREDVKTALLTTHRELNLEGGSPQALTAKGH
jgi:aspartokinase/homoserine dehydrogenase 1